MEFKETLKNNKDETVYITGRNRVHINEKEDTMLPSTTNEPISTELDESMLEIRRNNLVVYKKAMKSLNLSKFVLYSLPAIITAGNILLWTIPGKVPKTITAPKYTKTITTLSNDGTCSQEVLDNYYNNSFFGYNFVDKNNVNFDSSQSKVEYIAYNSENGVKLSFDLNDEKLNYRESSSGLYTDIGYNGEVNDKIYNVYSSLFDDILDYVVSNNVTGKTNDLKKITADEKAKIIIEITEYMYQGDEKVQVYDKHWFLRILFGLAAFIYVIVYDTEKHSWKSCPTLKYNKRDGRLYFDHDEEEELKNLELKYQEIFIEAERIRLSTAYKDFMKVSDESHISQVFTPYEIEKVLNKKPKNGSYGVGRS